MLDKQKKIVYNRNRLFFSLFLSGLVEYLTSSSARRACLCKDLIFLCRDCHKTVHKIVKQKLAKLKNAHIVYKDLVNRNISFEEFRKSKDEAGFIRRRNKIRLENLKNSLAML